jgi:hypothetical protein
VSHHPDKNRLDKDKARFDPAVAWRLPATFKSLMGKCRRRVTLNPT